MKPIKSKLARAFYVGHLIASCALIVGFAMATLSPAFADDWHRGHGHHDRDRDFYGYYNPGPIIVRPRPIVVAPAPYYYEPQPTYYVVPPPPPPPVYYQPVPVYEAPSLNVVIPFHFH